MYVFVDDSGDPGFQFERGSTRLMVITCLIFRDSQQISAVSDEIEQLRARLGRASKNEFKFSKMRIGLAQELLELVCRHSFEVNAVVVEKSHFAELAKTISPKKLYGFALATAISVLPQGAPAHIKIDGKGDRRIKLDQYGLAFPKIRKLQYVDSRSDSMIQLADVLAGFVRRAHDSEDALHEEYSEIYARNLESRTRITRLKRRPGT